jgi:RNA polymerase sigma-70 factor, ECF subfamily
LSRLLERSLNVGHPAPVTTSSLERVDEPRLTRIVGEHFDVLWRFLRRLGIPEADVDDAVQEVILVLARKLHHVQVPSERSFVLSTAFRVASGFRRSTRRRREIGDGALADLESDEPGPEAYAERQRLRAVLQSVLDALPLELRVVFVLYELEELTMAEIATTLELPPGTVASRLRRARETFERLAGLALHREDAMVADTVLDGGLPGARKGRGMHS